MGAFGQHPAPVPRTCATADLRKDRLSGWDVRFRARLAVGNNLIASCRFTTDTDLHLCMYFGQTPGYWLRVQLAFDLREAHGVLHGHTIRRIETFILDPPFRESGRDGFHETLG